ncbi:MAG: hypothetical protein SPL13_06555 [Clostridia bacterium]|nr:hypothetical protein [Clostridia bacterium]
MKDELNSYGILNSDGVSQPSVNDGKLSFDNDRIDYVSESVKPTKDEIISVPETYDDRKDNHNEENDEGGSTLDLSSMSQTATSTSTASAVSSSVGGGFGAIAGVVAASVAAVAVVVAVILSTLAINLSLVMSDMNMLVFEVNMTGASESDFVQPIYAVLTGENTYREQEVRADTVLLTFNDLEPGQEYFLTIKNEEKVFAKVSAFTTTEPNHNGDIVSGMEGNEVFVSVRNAELKANEFYTLIAKDAKGNVVFSKDGVEPFVEYNFTLDEPKDLYFYLMVNGKTYAISQIRLPEYDLTNGVWTWNEEYTAATITFTDKKGVADLVLDATITRKTVNATCEDDGSITYTAEATYQGKSYVDKKVIVLESTGHEYEGIFGEDGSITYTCPHCGDTYTE